MRRSLPLPHRLLLFLLSPLLLCACRSTADTTGQTSDGFPAPDREMVWMAAERALSQQGFVLDPVSSSHATGVLQTRWDLSMQPFSGQGYRDQVTVRIKALPNNPDRYTVETNVLRQRNNNMTEPSNPVAAEWTDGDRVPDLENLITRRIEMVFLSPDVSSQFRSSRGMAPGTSGRVETEPPKPKKDPWAWAYPK